MRSFLRIGVVLGLALAGCDGGGSSSQGGGGQGATGGGGAGGQGGQGGAGGAMAESQGARLYRYLTGHFDSTEQSMTDAAYYPIDLLTCPIDIPELGTRLLHVEQSIIDNGQPLAPYRQRVYVVEDGADPATQAVSKVWEFNTPGPFSGFCGGTGDQATAADIVEKAGCRVELTWMTDHFEGSTPGEECLTDFQGATYTTSEVKVFEDRIESWDRGWDATDQQVWGATKGPYLFDRLTPLPEPNP